MPKKNNKPKIHGKKVQAHHLVLHLPKREVLIRAGLFIAILFGYTYFLAEKFGFKDGGLLAAVTWSFFVLATPVADAGLVLDLPMRLITKIKMIYTELIVTVLAVLINVLALNFYPEVYQKSFVTQVFYKILTHPWPFWSIFIVSAVGTFYSVLFADEMLDIIHHHQRKKHHEHGFKLKVILTIFVFLMAYFAYRYITTSLQVTI